MLDALSNHQLAAPAYQPPGIPLDRRGLPPGAALLPGRLSIIGKVLVIDVWCSHCRRHHRHGWPSAHPNDKAHRVAHCHVADSPYRQRGYFITPDPLYSEENRATLRRFLNMRPDIVAALAVTGASDQGA